MEYRTLFALIIVVVFVLMLLLTVAWLTVNRPSGGGGPVVQPA